MGRNHADALCVKCGNSFWWLIGTPLICPDCIKGKEKTENKWHSLGGDGYTIKDLGRPAIFLIPVKKLKLKAGDLTVEEYLHKFLTENFCAYTCIPSFGFYKSAEGAIIFDECRQYEVSMLGKERIPILLKKLADVAKIIGEECIYVKAGQYSGLLYPS